MESINTESPLKLPMKCPGKSKKNSFVKFDTHAKKKKKNTKCKETMSGKQKAAKCVRRRGEKEQQGIDVGCGFTGFDRRRVGGGMLAIGIGILTEVFKRQRGLPLD